MTTYTFVTLDVSETAYVEIKEKLLKAGYDHCILPSGEIDMHGIALTNEEQKG